MFTQKRQIALCGSGFLTTAGIVRIFVRKNKKAGKIPALFVF